MAKPHDHITPELRAFILAQRMFFVATAPLSAGGRVNVSPKGLDSFRVLGDTRVAYLDLTGSGNETSAHLEENGRITLMFCALEGAAKIVRLYGRGRTVLPGGDGWEELTAQFEMLSGARQIIVVEIERAQTSCGWGVPLYEYRGERDELEAWAERKGAEGLEAYWRTKNTASIDGIETALGKALREP